LNRPSTIATLKSQQPLGTTFELDVQMVMTKVLGFTRSAVTLPFDEAQVPVTYNEVYAKLTKIRSQCTDRGSWFDLVTHLNALLDDTQTRTKATMLDEILILSALSQVHADGRRAMIKMIAPLLRDLHVGDYPAAILLCCKRLHPSVRDLYVKTARLVQLEVGLLSERPEDDLTSLEGLEHRTQNLVTGGMAYIDNMGLLSALGSMSARELEAAGRTISWLKNFTREKKLAYQFLSSLFRHRAHPQQWHVLAERLAKLWPESDRRYPVSTAENPDVLMPDATQTAAGNMFEILLARSELTSELDARRIDEQPSDQAQKNDSAYLARKADDIDNPSTPLPYELFHGRPAGRFSNEQRPQSAPLRRIDSASPSRIDSSQLAHSGPETEPARMISDVDTAFPTQDSSFASNEPVFTPSQWLSSGANKTADAVPQVEKEFGLSPKSDLQHLGSLVFHENDGAYGQVHQYVTDIKTRCASPSDWSDLLAQTKRLLAVYRSPLNAAPVALEALLALGALSDVPSALRARLVDTVKPLLYLLCPSDHATLLILLQKRVRPELWKQVVDLALRYSLRPGVASHPRTPDVPSTLDDIEDRAYILAIAKQRTLDNVGILRMAAEMNPLLIDYAQRASALLLERTSSDVLSPYFLYSMIHHQDKAARWVNHARDLDDAIKQGAQVFTVANPLEPGTYTKESLQVGLANMFELLLTMKTEEIDPTPPYTQAT
jgi:hypothetical protein